jgi:STE24 endopeptidase
VILALGWLPYALMAGPPSTAAPPSATRDAVAQLIAATRLPADGVRLVADPGFSADVTGGFGRAEVSAGPLLLAGPPDEARAYVGHLIGHYVHHDVLIVCLVVAAVAFVGCLAAQRWTAPLARALGGQAVRGAADPRGLPALAVLGGATLVCAGLAGGAYLRWANVGADAYSLDHAQAPDGLAAVIEREWDHAAVAPSSLETALFYTHPPLSTRIAHAMAWKAAHG